MPVRSSRDRGSALMLMPAATLVVFLLGSIALDFSVMFLRQRQALNLAADVANSAAVEGIDAEAFRETGDFEFSPARLDAVAERYERLAPFEEPPTIEVEPEGTDHVLVTITYEYDLVFAGIVPGAERHRVETSTARARAQSSA